jgi:hypothetical protein
MGMGMTINQMIDDLCDEVKEAAITLQSTLASLDRLEGVQRVAVHVNKALTALIAEIDDLSTNRV